MFNPLTWLDGILLGAAQKLCDKVQRLTGLTKFRLEKWAVIMSVVFFWADAVSNPTGLIITANLYITFIMVVIVRIVEKEEVRFLASGELTPSLFHESLVRLAIALGFGLLIALTVLVADEHLLSVCAEASYVAWVYFSTCIPRPPSKSTMREWYEKALWRLDDMLQPTTDPALDR